MESVPVLKPSKNENTKNYKIEHLPELDVVVNLDYPNKKDTYDIIEALKKDSLDKTYFAGVRFAVSAMKDESGEKRFFVKKKRDPKSHIDFIRYREVKDPIRKEYRNDFDAQSRYALVGILNEINMSHKVKDVVSSQPVQELVKKYGFSGMGFCEPIVALQHKRYKSLVYRTVEHKNIYSKVDSFKDLSVELRKIFFQNNIYPHDLRNDQFITTEKDGQPYIVLVDIEAYTPIEKNMHPAVEPLES